MKRVVFLLFAGLLLALLAPTVQTAYGADDVKKGRKTYTVNEEHIRRQEAEKAAPSDFAVYVRSNLTEKPLMHKVYFLLYLIMPFAILGICLLMEFIDGWDDRLLLFLLGAFELLFAAGNAGIGHNMFPWFCDYDIVGWVVAIICFCYMIRMLLKQAPAFIGFVNHYCCDCSLLRRLLLYGIYVALGVTVTMLLSGQKFFWTAPVAIAAAWYYFYDSENMSPSEAARTVLVSGVIFGGFVIFLLQVVGMIIIVAMVMFFLNGFASIKTSPVVDDGSPNHNDGMLERSADGTPFVRHSDGSSTQLRDLGDGNFEGFDGSPWRSNGDHMSR